MVDRRVPGVVEVTPAQILAARALTKWERASGGNVEGAVEAIARLKPDESPGSVDDPATKVAVLTEVISSAMRSMAQIAELRAKLTIDFPELNERLAFLEQEASQSIAKIVEGQKTVQERLPAAPHTMDE